MKTTKSKKKYFVGVRKIFLVYWSAYGGWKSLFSSFYLLVSVLLLVILYPFWTKEGWWDTVITIMPNMIGFSLAGLSIWLATGDEKLKIEINEDLFLHPNKFDEITDDVSFTGLIYGEKSVESYLYILNNKSIAIDRDLPIPGLSFTFVSCNDKISFFLINEKTFRIFKLLDVERENIKEFKVEDNQKYQSTLYKSSSGISATGVGTVLGTAVPIIGPIIGGLFGYGVSKLKAKIKENSHKTIEKTGAIFHLICNRGNKEFTISIACESLRAKSFKQLLEQHWSANDLFIQNK